MYEAFCGLVETPASVDIERAAPVWQRGITFVWGEPDDESCTVFNLFNV